MKKKIRILNVAQSAGGVDRYIRMLIKYLDHEKFENICVCSQDFDAKEYKGLVSRYEQIDMYRDIGISDLLAVGKIRKLIKKYKPDIVYAHSSKAGAIVRIANIGLNNCCIYNPHGWAFNMRCAKIKQIVYALIEKIASHFCHRIICISDAEKKSALDKKICKENKLKVIFNGIDIDEYEAEQENMVTKEALGIPKDAFVVGMVGRISEQKAPDIFIKAANLIKKDIPSAHFLIVGSGEMEESVRNLAKKNGIGEAVHITGWVSNPMSYIELFDVAALLSRWEGFGLVIPEYMLAGKPVVASNVDAIPNIITDHKNGLLVKVDDPHAAYEAVMELVHNKDLRDRLVKNGKADVYERFNARRVAKEHEALFASLGLV